MITLTHQKSPAAERPAPSTQSPAPSTEHPESNAQSLVPSPQSPAPSVPKRLRVLISAYACEPYKGSEPEVGWQWVLQIARYNEVWVLTRANNQSPIEKELGASSFENLHFIYVDLPDWAKAWKKGGRGVHLYYLLWQISALKKARQLHKKFHFQIAHHVTFSPFYQPALIALLPVPFVWGPVGGGEEIPKAFFSIFSGKQKAREGLRKIIHRMAPLNPFVRIGLRRASVILAATKDTQVLLSKLARGKVFLEYQVGMNKPAECCAHEKAKKPFLVLTAGRHVYWKGIVLVIRAFDRFVKTGEKDAKLVVLSSGPDTEKLTSEAERLGIGERVEFPGWLPNRASVFDYYQKAHVFAYASLLECAGYVALEAMHQGLPVICLDLPGPGEIVDSSSGIIIPAHNPENVVIQMSEALESLYHDRDKLTALATGARQRAIKAFDWTVKGDRLNEIYSSLLEQKVSG
jgi:glycosyltransferase involved in cell wall biosynthesis